MFSYAELNMQYQSGDLNILYDELSSLEGCPNHITGNFTCNHNNLTSLSNGPTNVDLTFTCSYNHLTSLLGGPTKVGGNYYCIRNQLTDLVGCASHIGGELNFRFNKITSLVGIHKIVKSCDGFIFDDGLITEGGIGLLLIDDLDNFSCYHEPFAIIEKYLSTGTKGMMECRKELIKKGYAPYAKL